MLIMNDHDLHLIREFVDYCFELEVNIVSFLLPAHSTHLLQSLDIDVFQSFKHYHQEILENSIQFSNVDYKRTDFLASFQKMQDLTFKKVTICSAFQKSDLFPFNPLAVLERVQEFATPERSLQPENEEDELYFEMNFKNMSTLYFLHAYNVCFSYINKKLTQNIEAELSLSLTITRLIKKCEKTSRTLKLSDQLAIKELYKKKQTELNRTQHNDE